MCVLHAPAAVLRWGIQACFRPERAPLRGLPRNISTAEIRGCSDARGSRGDALPTACAVEAVAAVAMSENQTGKALLDAASAGNTGEVTRLLEAGVPVNWAEVEVSMGVCGAGGEIIGCLGWPGKEPLKRYWLRPSAAAWPRRLGKRRSSGQQKTGALNRCECCWTAAPTWRPRTRSAHRLRHSHVAPPACFEVAMRPAAVPGRGQSGARAAGPGARTGERRVGGGCVGRMGVCVFVWP